MIDYANIVVKRLKDKASPSWISLRDRTRSWKILRNKRIKAGAHVVFKRGVQIAICETGELILGDSSFFDQEVWILLTMPKPRVRIGRNVTVGRGTIIASKNSIEIGDFSVIAPRCYFVDHEHGFSEKDIILNQRSVLKTIQVGRDCYFGTGAVITGGITIGDGAVIGAGSIVTKNIPAYEIWAGNPAQFIKKRENIKYDPNY